MCDDVKKVKDKKETFFGDDFYTYLVENDSTSFLEVISVRGAKHRNKAIRTLFN